MKTLTILFLLYLPAAETEPATGDEMVCSIIRGYVSIYGIDAAEKYVKDHRWSKERIAAARKCLSK